MGQLRQDVRDFGERRARDLLSVIEGLRQDQVDAIASDIGIEMNRVLDGVMEAMVAALLAVGENRITVRQAKRQVRAILEG
jgi:hypothetical protein